MSDLLHGKLRADLFSVEELVAATLNGEIRVPGFQRPLRWGRTDAIRLFESILRGYPVGTLLLWSRPAAEETITLGGVTIAADAAPVALWAVDGQQRITTLVNALTDEGAQDPRFGLAFLPESGAVVPAGRGGSGARIPLPVLADGKRLLGWFHEHPDYLKFFDAASAASAAIRQYQIPASIVTADDPAVLRDIFDRLNSYGKRLSRAEVFAALHPSESSESPIERIADGIRMGLDFGDVDGDTILRAVLARRGPDVTREIRTEFDVGARDGDFPGEDRETAYREAEIALTAAIRFLQWHADVPHFAFLPYRYLLVVLTRFFSHHPQPGDRSIELLRRWLWRGASVGPYVAAGSTTSTMRLLCQQVVPGDEQASLTGLLRVFDDQQLTVPRVDRFRTNHASGKIIACVLWAQQPRTFPAGRRIEAAELAEALVDAQTPRRALADIGLVAADGVPADSVARWVLAPGTEYTPAELRTLVCQDRPTSVAAEAWAQTLDSHLISPRAHGALRAADIDRYRRIREDDVHTAVTHFLQVRWAREFEDTPSLASFDLDELELSDVPSE